MEPQQQKVKEGIESIRNSVAYTPGPQMFLFSDQKPDFSTKHQKKIHIKSSVAPEHDSSTVSLAVSYYRLQTLNPLQLLPTCTVTGRGGGLRRKEEGRAHWRNIVTNLM